LSHYLVHDDVLAATDSDNISICTTEEMEKYESLCRREFAHTHVYDVSILERVGLDEELPTILWTIGWGKLYEEPHLASQDHLVLVDKPVCVIPVFMPKLITHRMHDPGSVVPHIRPKVFTDYQMSRIKYNYYISSVSKGYDDSQRNGTAEHSITPQERQPGQHVA
jgi:hypothetical protein